MSATDVEQERNMAEEHVVIWSAYCNCPVKEGYIPEKIKRLILDGSMKEEEVPETVCPRSHKRPFHHQEQTEVVNQLVNHMTESPYHKSSQEEATVYAETVTFDTET